jgi:Asp-tRNA(Asn)/Glu-tRNA(Gln) amidotransferase A subunit family amidase
MKPPIARDLVVCGSTSGAAAALASGDADLGIGTDTAGSIRIPAACTGVHDKAVKLGELELPVLRAMIYETFLLNMYGAPVVTLPDHSSTGGLAESVPFSFQIAGPHRSTYPA